jgi:hypothetical protein
MKADDAPGDDKIIVEPKEKSEDSSPDAAGADSSSSDSAQEKGKQNPPQTERKFTVPPGLAWIPQNLTWSKLKPVIRCSLVAWVSVVLMIIGPVSRSLGQVSVYVPPAASH